MIIYKDFIKTIKKVFRSWLTIESKKNMDFIKERRVIFIHKKGPEGATENYRPLSINNTLPRIFLKILNQKLEYTWDKITSSQFGFRKKFDTRIAVIKFQAKYKELKKTHRSKISILTIDIAKCYDSISYLLIRESIKKFVENIYIKNFLLRYYQGDGMGLYQGDPLSPILFAYISHFLIYKIEQIVKYAQMFADDLIIITKGSDEENKEKLKMIYQVIVQFGLKPNESKTIETKDPKKIIYLGIWLNPLKHLNSNKEKAQKTYQKYKYILLHKGFSRGLRIQLFKSFVLSQIDYGLEIFEYSKSQMTTLNTWINKRVKKILDVPIATPTEILQIECNIKDMNVNLNKRKVKLMEKLTTLNLDELKTEIQFQKYEFNTIDWANISSINTNYFIIQEIKNKIEKTNKKKVKIYLIIINKQNINFKAQKYLNWHQSSTIFKFRSHMTCLNRDRYSQFHF
ncbi:RNA-directed DNA polymerase from transposon x-element-like protein-related [Anaeramoeba flamelloides]|uniref:RNA-directed DNA polymerase from transposon x-element-like protein-related n=1 Tax=Anaeramoeba flamelloides TaxID=1746091 RepID=A0ABQ8XNS1_9EUKA|nr:RNA-directed DNA polymerase from transposon x-element-like protein-related [Anaeramoeba flamelloides]